MRKPDHVPGFDLPQRLVLGVCALVVAAAVFGACTKKEARTANDIAGEACSLFATQEAEKAGINLADIGEIVSKACDAKEKSQPFLDALLAVQRETAVERASAMGIAADD